MNILQALASSALCCQKTTEVPLEMLQQWHEQKDTLFQRTRRFFVIRQQKLQEPAPSTPLECQELKTNLELLTTGEVPMELFLKPMPRHQKVRFICFLWILRNGMLNRTNSNWKTIISAFCLFHFIRIQKNQSISTDVDLFLHALASFVVASKKEEELACNHLLLSETFHKQELCTRSNVEKMQKEFPEYESCLLRFWFQKLSTNTFEDYGYRFSLVCTGLTNTFATLQQTKKTVTPFQWKWSCRFCFFCCLLMMFCRGRDIHPVYMFGASIVLGTRLLFPDTWNLVLLPLTCFLSLEHLNPLLHYTNVLHAFLQSLKSTKDFDFLRHIFMQYHKECEIFL